jgi:hypothetical protein
VVQNADLSSPLQKNILKDAKETLQEKVPRKFAPLIRKTKHSLKRKKILSVTPEDVGKFEG